jgi:hypothetical protein
MANRSFIDKAYQLVKRRVDLYAAVSVGAAGAVTLLKWNYPTFGAGPNARTYTAAPTANALPTGAPYPLQYGCGSEGVRSVTRTGAGQWLLQLQDNYQRHLGVGVTLEIAGGVSTGQLAINSTTTNMNANGGSVLGLTTIAGGVAADLASGTIANLRIFLADATEP